MEEKEQQPNEITGLLTSKKNQFLDIRFENLSYSVSKRGKGTHFYWIQFLKG